MTRASESAGPPHRSGRSAASGPRDWAGTHPVIGYLLLAYAFSWSSWGLASLIGGAGAFVLVVVGGFGPPAAAAVMLRLTGRSLRDWGRSILAWRVPWPFYAYALLLPLCVQLGVNIVLSVNGAEVDWAALPDRLPGYAASLVITAVLFGGMEEPGWRGYALPLLQDLHRPAVATLLLGLAWGIWHVPLYGPAGFVVPLVLAFFYTWLYNRTGSVLLCILLHGGFTAAQDTLLLTADSATVDLTILSLYVLGAALLLAATRGRLGHPRGTDTDLRQETAR
ncbi:type II CAAX endopeptidase family protein [Kocuria sp. CPCC 205292]|uniref:CPBP family intramembrane glutamic endopeptidase n=1 Tax=Kocuria cellulosilytica TaxID=3071451 RepID=UPI0034D4F6B8